jgi:hypothetical protein
MQSIDASRLERRFKDLKSSKVPSAIRNTLNDLAFDMRGRMIDEMRKVFDRPTAAALRVPYVRRASKTSLHADLYLSDYQDSKGGKGPSHALTHHMTGQGDARSRKGVEKRLTAIGLLAPTEWLVPAAGAKLNGNGNVTGAQSMKILADLGGLGQYAGDASNTATNDRTVRGRKGRAVRRKGRKVVYFWLRNAGSSGRISGVFRKNGDQLIPVMVVVKRAPPYVKRLRWQEIVNSYSAKRVEYHARRAIAQAMRGAGK